MPELTVTPGHHPALCFQCHASTSRRQPTMSPATPVTRSVPRGHMMAQIQPSVPWRLCHQSKIRLCRPLPQMVWLRQTPLHRMVLSSTVVCLRKWPPAPTLVVPMLSFTAPPPLVAPQLCQLTQQQRPLLRRLPLWQKRLKVEPAGAAAMPQALLAQHSAVTMAVHPAATHLMQLKPRRHRSWCVLCCPKKWLR